MAKLQLLLLPCHCFRLRESFWRIQDQPLWLVVSVKLQLQLGVRIGIQTDKSGPPVFKDFSGKSHLRTWPQIHHQLLKNCPVKRRPHNGTLSHESCVSVESVRPWIMLLIVSGHEIWWWIAGASWSWRQHSRLKTVTMKPLAKWVNDNKQKLVVCLCAMDNRVPHTPTGV